MSKARDLSKLLTDGLSSVLADNSIGLPKLSNITTDRLVGRDSAGTGAIEQISVSGGLEFTDATGLRTTAFTGDVTKSAGGTATTIEALAVTTAKIADLNVTTAKIADLNVTTAKIADGNVTLAKLGSGVALLGTASEFTQTQNFNATGLTDGATIDWNLALNQVAKVTLAGNRSMNAPTNQVDGAVYILTVTQDATGTRTLSWNAAFKFPGGVAPTLTSTGLKSDILTFLSNGTFMFGVSSLSYANS